MTRNKLNRRQDDSLRAAIDRIQLALPAAKSCAELYANVLTEVLTLTGSECGFIAEEKSGNHSFRDCDIYKRFASESSLAIEPDRIVFKDGLRYFNPTFSSARTAVFNETELSDFSLKNLGLPDLHSMAVIPIVEGKITFAALCLINTSKVTYSPTIDKRLWPLLTSAVCIRRTIRSRSTGITKNPVVPQVISQASSETLALVEESCPIGVIEINQNHKVVKFNPAAENIFGIKNHAAIDKEISNFIPERFPNEHRMHTFASTPDATRVTNDKIKFLAHRADQCVISIEVATVPYLVNGQTHHILMVQDHSELEKSKAAQESQVQKFKAVSDLAPVGILHTNKKWECVYVNDRWSQICRMSNAILKGKGWINAIYRDDVDETLHDLHDTISAGNEFKRECRFQTSLGEIAWVEFHARPLFDVHGSIDGFIATLFDVTYRRLSEEKLRLMAEKDSLTGLANRALFQDRLHQALARVERHGSLALLCLDLDGFKNINDSLGHDAGDVLLQEVSMRLKTSLRSEDTVARVGGDEFMVLVENISDVNFVGEVCDKILSRLEAPLTIASQEVFITASIGISFCISSQALDHKSLMKQADIALYRAKAEGRNNYQFYSPELELASRERLSITNSLHRALKRNEFELFYQLQVESQDDCFLGAEALLRWRHPERGLLEPAEFITLLEETRLMLPVGRWILIEAFSTFKSWLDQGLIREDGHISINLSPVQLRDPQLVHAFDQAIQQSKLSGSQILVEITESALLEESINAKEILLKLKAWGIRIALDDFGTGYSSLTYLKRFPIDCIKIDRSFVQDMLSDSEDRAITQAVIALASSLNLDIVAEGVDSQEKLDMLDKWGCHLHQGYFINAPFCAGEAEDFLRNRLNTNISAIPMPL